MEVISTHVINNQAILEVQLINTIPDKDGNYDAYNLRGLWDTGAATTTVKESFIKAANLEFVKYKSSSSVSEKNKEIPIFKGVVKIGKYYKLDEIALGISESNERIDMLIGMDIISTGIFSIDTNKTPLVVRFLQKLKDK